MRAFVIFCSVILVGVLRPAFAKAPEPTNVAGPEMNGVTKVVPPNSGATPEASDSIKQLEAATEQNAARPSSEAPEEGGTTGTGLIEEELVEPGENGEFGLSPDLIGLEEEGATNANGNTKETIDAVPLSDPAVAAQAEQGPPLPPLTDAMFRVREYEGDIELTTPWGNYVIPGEYGRRFGMTDYRFSVPVRELMPETFDQESEAEEGLSEEDEDEDEENEDVAGEDRDPSALPPGSPPLVRVDDTDTMIVEANRLYNQRRYFEALTVVDRIVRKVPDNPRVWLMRGSLMLVQGHKELAMKSYEQALKLAPDDPEIRALVERYQ